MRSRGASALLVTSVLVVAGLSSCSHDPYASYCHSVTDKRNDLSTILDAGGPVAFLTALPILKDLRDHSPADIHDDWQQVVTSIEGLSDALKAADVDPATYDRDHPPAGVSAAEKDGIDAAATVLDGAQTQVAFSEIQQEVRDVCHTPLLLG